MRRGSFAFRRGRVAVVTTKFLLDFDGADGRIHLDLIVELVVGAAFVTLRPGAETTPGEIVLWCRQNMANYKVPRHVEIIDQLPLTATLKVRKDVLRDRLRGGAVAV